MENSVTFLLESALSHNADCAAAITSPIMLPSFDSIMLRLAAADRPCIAILMMFALQASAIEAGAAIEKMAHADRAELVRIDSHN